MFRILDLGAHDGFVSLWLARRLVENGVDPTDIVIDGLELHPHGVEVANRRATAEGFRALYKQGMAEDASSLFHVGTYDAVIAFEIIEHVPDVNLFLSVCEDMAKPGGQVYLSTPNGTFGEGQNPHHLRVYRDIDLFNICRQRGTVEDLHQGRDGVAVLRYTPTWSPRPTAAIYAGAGWETWHPRDITERGLGGSETAAIRLAEALSDAGYVVTVYGEVEQGMWRQVELRHHSVFDPMEPRDLLIVSRTPQMFDRKHRAKKAMLWMHDTDYGPGAINDERLSRIDKVLVLSGWHAVHVEKMYPGVKAKLYVIGNGINPDFFPLDMIPTDRPRRAIYSSSPDRGLDIILSIWPQVRERVPEAELVYCYADVYNKVADVRPDIAEFRKRCALLADQPGVVNLGSLPQDALAAAMAMCRVWLAPSYNTVHDVPFNETFCIGAVEAAAAGCHRIMANHGALPERADESGDYTLMPTITDQETEEAWVDAIVRHLTDDDKVFHSCPRAREITWAKVARDILG